MPQNSGYTTEFRLWSMSVPHPRLPSHLHLEFLPDQNPVEIELPKLEIGLAKLELSIYKTNQANPISSFGNSISTGFWSGKNSRWRWEGRRGWGTDMDHSRNSVVYPEFCGILSSKKQKLHKRLYMPISKSTLTVYALNNYLPIIYNYFISSNEFQY